jgi:hypothetical protein
MATKTKKTKQPQVLILRTCKADGTAYNNFKWPLEVGAVVTAPDFEATKECGKGFHGLLWGSGNANLVSKDKDAIGMVCSVNSNEIIELDGKVKFQSCKIEFVGTLVEAATYIAKQTGRVVHFAMVSDEKLAVTGYSGTATAGEYGTATAGEHGTATAGYSGTATAGNRGTATAGEYGKATAGEHGTATAGYSGTATAGEHGTATAGYSGTATAGEHGTATAGNGGIATAGYSGTIQIKWHDGNRYRTAVGYVGENSIEANVAYRLNPKGEFVKA